MYLTNFLLSQGLFCKMNKMPGYSPYFVYGPIPAFLFFQISGAFISIIKTPFYAYFSVQTLLCILIGKEQYPIFITSAYAYIFIMLIHKLISVTAV